MTRRSGLLAFMTVVLVGLTLVSRAPRHRPVPVLTDTPVTVHADATVSPVRSVTVGRKVEDDPLPRYTEPDKAGIAAFVDGRFYEAREHLSQAVADDPRDAESFSNLGQVLVKLGRHDEAIDRFEQALHINPSRWAYHFNLAGALGDAGQWERAIAEYEAAADLAPREFVTHYNLGRALHERGRDRAAIAAYRTAIDLNPNDPSFHLSLGVSYETLEHWDDALSAYQASLDLAPERPEAEALKWHIVALMEDQHRAQAGG